MFVGLVAVEVDNVTVIVVEATVKVLVEVVAVVAVVEVSKGSAFLDMTVGASGSFM